jgi:hypothetical protein
MIYFTALTVNNFKSLIITKFSVSFMKITGLTVIFVHIRNTAFKLEKKDMIF